MENLGIAPDVMRRRVEDTLDLLGLHELRNRPLSTLSGGQQQRVAIGAVLTASPRRAGARRADVGSRSGRRRGGPGLPSPVWSTTSASPCCWPSTASSGSCSSPIGSCCSGVRASRSSPGPRRASSPTPPASPPVVASAAWRAGRLSRCRSVTPDGRPSTCVPVSPPSSPLAPPLLAESTPATVDASRTGRATPVVAGVDGTHADYGPVVALDRAGGRAPGRRDGGPDGPERVGQVDAAGPPGRPAPPTEGRVSVVGSSPTDLPARKLIHGGRPGPPGRRVPALRRDRGR